MNSTCAGSKAVTGGSVQVAETLRRPVLALAILIAVAACVDSERLSGEQVLDRMLEAIGPETARNSVQSLTATAEGIGPDGSFAVTVTSIPPGAVYFRQQTVHGITEIWSTPERTWGGTVGEDYEPMGPRVREYVRGHEFHLMLLEVKSRFSGFAMQGEESVEGSTCLRVSMRDESGQPASICVRPDDWLPLELRLHSESSAGPVRVVFADWRQVDGLYQFHATKLVEDPERLFSYQYVDVAINSFAYDISVPAPVMPRVQSEDRPDPS